MSTLGLGRQLADSGSFLAAHSHDFLTLAYSERDGGSLRSGVWRWQLRAGDAFVVQPGDVHEPGGLVEA